MKNHLRAKYRPNLNDETKKDADALVFVGDWLPTRVAGLHELFGECLVVGNLECAVSNEAHFPEKAHGVVLNEDAFSIIGRSGFSALNVANNHVMDAGETCFSNMLNEMHGRNPRMQLYGTRSSPAAFFDVGGSRVGVIGCIERCRARGSSLFRIEDVEHLIEELCSSCDQVVVTPHWGKESEYTVCPSPAQCALAKRWIGAGASGVIGHHSHTVQGKALYGNACPCYFSVGNFDFPHLEGSAYPLTKFGLAVAWSPKMNFWKETLVQSDQDHPPRFLARSQCDATDVYFRSICELVPASRSFSAFFGWARIVGPVYIRKSYRSWAKRLRFSFVKAGPKFVVWQFLPSTLVFLLASCFPDRRATMTIDRFLESCVDDL